MENERTDNSMNPNDDEQLQALLLLFLWADRQWDDEWDQFERDLIYKNRFFSDCRIVTELHSRAEQASLTIQRGAAFYRARVYPKSSYDKPVEYFLKGTGVSIKDLRKNLPALSDTQKRAILLAQLSGNDWQRMISEEASSALAAAIKKWKNNVPFKGYSAKDSAAPPADLSGSQRANPDHIRYLYLAEDNITPIYEVRPIIGAHVSVAKFRLLKDIKVYDLTKDLKDPNDSPDMHFPSLFNTIGQKFSKPVNGYPLEYLPTQYLAEEIKRMGFDGLRFNSSLHKGGVNLVLFNPEECRPISSELVKVTGIDVSTEDAYVKIIGNHTEESKKRP